MASAEVSAAAATAAPIVFGDCFGWLHLPPAGAAKDLGIVLCAPLHREAYHAHQSIRRLAMAFAAAGYPALRFDYPATGDSADLPETDPGAEHLSAWRDAAGAAGDRLRAQTGVRQLCFVGLRFGALVAALAAEARQDVAALVLIAPVLRGKSYVTQLAMETRLQSGIGKNPDGSLAAQELRLSAETVRRIEALDLREIRFAGKPRIALFAPDTAERLAPCMAAWMACGATPTIEPYAGLEPILRDNAVDPAQAPDLDRILAWTAEYVPAAPLRLGPPAGAAARLALPGCIERPIFFGPDDRLFGILCEPRNGAAGQSAVIMGNPGRDPHYGSARLSVALARAWAAQGIASLRFDFAGLGDSAGPATQTAALSPMFAMGRESDVAAAMDAMNRHGYRRFALHGLCAGAYHALQASLADRRVEALLLLNLPFFHYRDADTVGQILHRSYTLRQYLPALVSRDVWRRLLRREIDLGMILRARLERLRERTPFLRSLPGGAAPLSIAESKVARLAARPCRMLLLFSGKDDGIAEMVSAFGPEGARLAALPGCAVRIMPDWDHMVSGQAAQTAAAAMMRDFLIASPPDDPQPQRAEAVQPHALYA